MDDVFICDDCGDEFDSQAELDGHIWTCDECGEVFHGEDSYDEHQEYCSGCDRHFCGYSAYEDHMRYCDECSTNYCPRDEDHSDCDDEYRDGNGIYNYGYKPSPDWRGQGPYYVGVELEISARSSASAQPIYDWAMENNYGGLFYCKEDGSVDGFEIVTHPMTPEYFESVNWDAFMEMLNDRYPCGGQESSEHGIHVHISRDAFRSPVALARWSYLLNKSQQHVERIARRSGSGWAAFRADHAVRDVLATDPRIAARRFADRHTTQQPIYCDCDGCAPFPERVRGILGYRPNPANSFKRFRPPHPPRYAVTNMTNAGTVEVRAFKSTRNADEFRDCVRLVYTSRDFVDRYATSAHNIPTWEAFTEYVRESIPAFFPTAAGIPA